MAQPLRPLFGYAPISGSNEAFAEQRRQSADVGVPIAQTRSVETLHQQNNTAPQMGRIAFNQYLANTSREELEKNKKYVQNAAISDALIYANTTINSGSANFLAQNPAGAGYTEYMTGLYSDTYNGLHDKYKNDPEVANAILNNGKRAFADHLPTWSKTELDLTDNAIMLRLDQNIDVQQNQIRLFPEAYSDIRKNLDQTLDAFKGAISDSKFEKAKREAYSAFNFQYAQALIAKDPRKTNQILANKEMISTLDPKQVDSLIRYGEQKVKDREKKAFQANLVAATIRNGRSKSSEESMRTMIDKGQITVEEEIRLDDTLEPIAQERLVRHLIAHRKEEIRIAEVNADISSRIAEGRSLSNITNDDQIRHYNDVVEAKEREIEELNNVDGGNRPPLSLTDKARLFKGYRARNDNMISEIANISQFNGDPAKVLDASIAYVTLYNQNPASFSKADPKYYNFANAMIDQSSVSATPDQAIVDQLRATYLSEKSSADMEIVKNKMQEFRTQVTSQTAYNEILQKHFDPWFAIGDIGRKFAGVNISLDDVRQFRKDMVTFADKAAFGGERDSEKARAIVVDQMKNLWSVVDGQVKRNVPTRVRPDISQQAADNFIALKVKDAVLQLQKSPTSQFVLLGETVKQPKTSIDFYNSDLRVDNKLIVGVKIGDKVVPAEVKYKNISMSDDPGSNGYYTAYCEVNGVKYPIKDPKNPALNMTMDFNGDIEAEIKLNDLSIEKRPGEEEIVKRENKMKETIAKNIRTDNTL